MMTFRSRWLEAVLSAGLLIGLSGGVVSTALSKSESTADHTKFEQLQGPFTSGPEVTEACLACHTEAAKQVHRTKHWTWEFLNPQTQQTLGKKSMVNNFCIGAGPNLAACASCHVGYGWKDDSFDFTSEKNVDCLACHDTTGTYYKPSGLAGHPVTQRMELPPGSGRMVNPVDLTRIAQRVGKSTRDTCGKCHFYGGGGDAVKHGDIDSSLAMPDREVDVHMDAMGLDFTCGTCHAASAHDIPGSRFTPTVKDEGGQHIRGMMEKSNPATCVACHGNRPHTLRHVKLNDHGSKIACETCHIPSYARGGLATKMSWDWSTAGKMDENGKPFTVKDKQGLVIYDSRKGDFTLGKNVVPEYVWFNGNVRYTLITDEIDPTRVVKINSFEGDPYDGKSMIYPVKVHRGKQPYDTEHKTLLVPKTAGRDDASYWHKFDWDKSLASGMATVGGSFSGKFDFVETEMRWPINHMVAPKEDALACAECHSGQGRLQNIDGIYMPGRDSNRYLNFFGWAAVLLTLIGVLIHGALRIIISFKGR